MDSNLKFMKQLERMGGKADDSEPTPVEGKIQYSSHPILNYRVGKEFIFENSVLTLEDEEHEKKFLAVINHKNFPPRERVRIKKLDLGAAEKLSLAVRATRGRTTQQIDSSIGERPDNAPKVGIGDLLKAGHPESEAKPIETEGEANARAAEAEHEQRLENDAEKSALDPEPVTPPDTVPAPKSPLAGFVKK